MVSYGYDPYYDILRLSYPDIKGHEMTSICWFGGIKLKIGRNKSSCQKTIERIFSMLMTSRKSEICFLGTTYKIFGIEGHDKLKIQIIYDNFKKRPDTFFDPWEQGFCTEPEITDIGNNYYCLYYVKYNRLILDKVCNATMWGKSRKVTNLLIPFTGGLLIGEEKHPQKMLDIKFRGGALKRATDLTEKLKAIKEAASEMQIFKEEQPSKRELHERSEVYKEIAKEFFSAEYIIIGVRRLLWDEMVNTYYKS